MLELEFSEEYGAIKPGGKFDIPEGYVVILGENNVGKSSVLQYIFKRLYESGIGGQKKRDDKSSFCFIPKNRDFISASTQPKGIKLQDFNSQLHSRLNGKPLQHNSQLVDFSPLCTVLINRSLHKQMSLIIDYVNEDGFGKYETVDDQIQVMNNIEMIANGSGLRCMMPIYGALSDEKLQYIIIDEPEASLEPKKQKMIRDRLIQVCKERGITIIVATHSHLFLNHDEVRNNFQLQKTEEGIKLTALESEAQFRDIAFAMYGSELADLFLPNNFIFCEGASDQVILEKIRDLVAPEEGKNIRVVACKGGQETEPVIAAFQRNLTPLIEASSPYSSILVTLIDKPNTPDLETWAEKLSALLDDRCFILPNSSLEEYLPEALYTKAGLDKNEQLKMIETTPKKERPSLKKNISNKIANVLSEDDLKSVHELVAVVKKALQQ